MTATIRPYDPRDRTEVRALCCETAFMGESLDRYFNDRELIGDALSRYYTDFEPEHCLVAENDGCVVGYFFGCANTNRFNSAMRWRIAPILTLKILWRGAPWRRGTRDFFWRIVRGVFAGHARLPDVPGEFPAHFHVNLAKKARGQGLGGQLIERGLELLREAGARGVHLQTIKQNTRAVELFRRLGFEPIHESPAPTWPEKVQPIIALTMTKKL